MAVCLSADAAGSNCKLNMMDGACDAPDETPPVTLGRSSNLLPLQPQPARLSRVRFLSDDNISSRQNSVQSSAEMTSRQARNAFTNPFSDEGSTGSRRTSSSSDTTDYFRPNAFAGHRDTLARLPLAVSLHKCGGIIWEEESTSDDSDVMDRPYPYPLRVSRNGSVMGPIFPRQVIDRLLRDMSFEDYKSLRLVCRRWNRELPRPNFPAFYRLPQELVQQIYTYLTPSDYDAARHACKAWYLASLDRNVQELMLRRQGSHNALAADLQRLGGVSDDGARGRSSQRTLAEFSGDYIFDQEWVCSKRLATESRLSADWHGPSSGGDPTMSRLFVIEEVVFSKALYGEKTPRRRVFTVSACGNFVLLVAGGEILVYRLWDAEHSMLPVVRLAPGIDVLGVSMDSSSGRYSVAALLEGRKGMLWDISSSPPEAQHDNGPGDTGEPLDLGLQTDVQSSSSIPVSQTLTFGLPMRFHEWLAANAEGHESSPLAILNGTPSTGFDEQLRGESSTPRSSSADDSSDEYDGVKIPVQTRPTAVYSQLGSSDDLPRSVAICPNRKCVAFGCRLGIELHWVNALTGGDLNRWFPLAAPSDYLYFLPQRPGIDSRKKLRLISSAAGPAPMQSYRSDGLPVRWQYWPTSVAHGRRQSTTRLFFGNLPFPASAVPSGNLSDSETPAEGDDVQGILRTVDCDHFRAVPISDGCHLLFTDPLTGLLCLGSDAPFGGPTKLTRKVVFVPPTIQKEQRSPPLLYSAGQALEWGLRVVAFHADGCVVLYSVPADILQRVQASNTTTDAWVDNPDVPGGSASSRDSQMNATPAASMDSDQASGNSQVISDRSIRIPGALIARVEEDSVDDLAIKSDGGDFSLWIFYRSGRSELYRIYSARDVGKRIRRVGDNGLVYDVQNDNEEESPWEDEATSKGKSSLSHVKWADTDGSSKVPLP
ncbi:hypothetical protein A1O1_01136 [Capronia coronata CBS 617.96]|uniref:F-box domain-containing protein n=1 Tax=Capronia coronata CBS 617.96 TaxID=1182541 RepID=W9Z239_9EURO|nr:uncharacterized protein A1O1_01136 [Capronia coronata CBS 617.96]EXJ96010.1 hypothetical protein A1O1_01136 [Capronia coronata CBS 617.96]